MNLRWLACVMVVLAAVAGGCSGGGGPAGTCAVTCGLHQVCDPGSTPPTCKCEPAYAGRDCSLCASGYVRGTDGKCSAVTISCAIPGICGVRGRCVSGSGTTLDTCVCNAGYAGHGCSTCDDGYQDNDRDGVCRESCRRSTMTVCSEQMTCADSSGIAKCSCPPLTTGMNCELCVTNAMRTPQGTCVMCPPNSTGPTCEQCLTGFVRVGEACVRSCATATPGCTTNQFCDTAQIPPTCACKVGYAGADCATCATGYALDAARVCVRSIPAGTDLLGAALYPDGEYLLAIDLDARTAAPLRRVPTGLRNLRFAADTATGTLYAANSSALGKVDLGTGAFTMLPNATIASVSNVAFKGGALYTVPGQTTTGSLNLLKRYDLAAMALPQDIGPTRLGSGQGLAFEPSGALVLMRPGTMGMPEFHRIDPMTATPVGLGALAKDMAALTPSDSSAGLAIDPRNGTAYVVARLGRTPNEIMAAHCQKIIAGLSIGNVADAPMTLDAPYMGIGVGGTKTLMSTRPSGSEVIGYVSYGQGGASTSKATMRIDTRNADSFICISTYQENLELVIAATARFAAIVVTGYGPYLSLSIEPGFPTPSTKVLHVYNPMAGRTLASVGEYSLSRVYTQPEWSALKLPTYASVWSSDNEAPAILLDVDLGTMAIKRKTAFPGVTLLPPITVWSQP